MKQILFFRCWPVSVFQHLECNQWPLKNLFTSLIGSRTLCFIATLLRYSFIPDDFTYYAQLSSPLCPLCIQHLRDSSDCEGALSQSSNDTVDLEGVDSDSLGILPELWYELLQESDIVILVLVVPSVSSIYASLVPRPKEEEEKGPGFSRSRMR